MREQTTGHQPKIATSKLNRFIAQLRRLATLSRCRGKPFSGPAITDWLRSESKRAVHARYQNARVQNSITDVTASPAPEKGDQVNVKTYGAVGDGVTNDTAAFNAALQSLADAGGGMCLVPKGTYLFQLPA